jgi:hypothetical protein
MDREIAECCDSNSPPYVVRVICGVLVDRKVAEYLESTVL